MLFIYLLVQKFLENQHLDRLLNVVAMLGHEEVIQTYSFGYYYGQTNTYEGRAEPKLVGRQVKCEKKTSVVVQIEFFTLCSFSLQKRVKYCDNVAFVPAPSPPSSSS